MSLAVKAARQQAVGDPGLFGSIGKFLGGAAKIVGGIMPGPIGSVLKFGGGLLAPGRTAPAPIAITRPAGFQRGGFSSFGGPARGRGVPVAAAPQITGAVGIACPAGMHANKSSYFLRDGTFVGKGTKCVSSRRRNPANSRANDRAIGRIESAKKMAARLGRISIRKECK